jgi:hypothetical protein
MRANNFKATLLSALRVVSILPLAAVAAFGQQQINLTAGPSSITMPDGQLVPMWGYSCDATQVTGSTATCAKLNPAATGWSPVVITVPTGQGLTINLTNSLSFATTGTPNNIPTSLVIVGQLGGGLGDRTQRTTTDSPVHPTQTLTWPAAGADATNTPPTQGPRVQSFSTEVAAGTPVTGQCATNPCPLTWSNLQPGTYLIESGTHPSIQGSMGLYGMLVVTTAPSGATAGTAYPGVSYAADVPLLLSEIDPVQNKAVSAAVSTMGFSEAAVWSGQPNQCGNPSSANYQTCYPPAVNYTPLYYLFNGVGFSKSNASASLFPASPASGVTGNVLVRLVNAGLRMHVPSIVGSQTGTASGFSLIAEDGNPLPGTPRVQSEVFLAAGKTYDVTINAPAAGGTALPIYDRQLSLSGNATARDAGMLAYIGINGAGLPGAPAFTAAAASADTYGCATPGCATALLPGVVPGKTLSVSDPAKGVIANDVNIYGVKVVGAAPVGLTLNTDGTFTYTAGAPTSFTYCGNGATSGPACATVALNAAPVEAGSGITCSVPTPAYTSTVATSLSIKPPGVLSFCKDAAGYPLTVNAASVTPTGFSTLSVDPNGGFNATVPAAGTYTFSFKAQNSQNTVATTAATVTLSFPAPSNLQVTLIDGKTKTPLPGSPQDYRWIIEEDRTFYINPATQTNTGAPGSTSVPIFGTNFHTSYMPVVAAGCTGTISCETGQSVLGVAAACDIGNGVCRTGVSAKTPVLPSQVVLDPTKRYYISVLPGDAIGVDQTGADLSASHAMGGAQIAAGQTNVTVIVEPHDLPTAKVSVFVFEDDFPLNGEHDAGGGVDVLATNEPGLGKFNITLFDDVGGPGDAAGQMTYDMFNMPLSNALAGTIDPTTGLDACPVSKNPLTGWDGMTNSSGITGVIPVCPNTESDGLTLSPLAGQAVIANLPPGRYGVVATPGADRITKGEEWLQTNTLDGGKAHDSFVKASEPGYFQEYGPAGYHVSIGFANPKIINDRHVGALVGTNTVTGRVTGAHMSRTPDERLYSTGSRDTFGYTQCYASLGSPDGGDFVFAKCADDGTFSLAGIPTGDWRVSIFDQWNDQIVDGITTPVRVGTGTTNMGDVAVHQWKTNLYTRTFFDQSGDGVSQDTEPGLTLVSTNIRFRDGSFSNFNSTDLDGFAGFNEVFPLFNWYVVETDTTRYKTTGTHVVYDAGGPVDGGPGCGGTGQRACSSSTIAANLARTLEEVPLPANLRVPGARYCGSADCPPGDTAGGSTGRVDPPMVHPFGSTYGWQGFIGQSSFLEFGKKPYATGENGGIKGHVVYASTRPFDDPALLLQLSWEPMVPHVTINLYQEGTAPDGSQSLKLVDTTQSSSWDDWAQGFRSDGVPNMNCPGQGRDTGTNADLFFFTLFNEPNYLDLYNSQHGGPPLTPLPNNSQFKCYDGLHNFNQLQPAPYDGMYQFPSVIGLNPTTGKPAGTNCHISTTAEPWGCIPNPDTTDPYRNGLPMLPAGKYVVEMIVPPGYELVKEEDKNILLGDTYVAPVTQQFAGAGNIFIMPDQAAMAATYNSNNPLIPTTDLGASPRHEGDTGSIESFWPCVGAARVVPDYMSIFPGSLQNAPFAGATRNLCDRKEVTLEDQMTVLAKFYVFSSTHVAAHFTGQISDDFTAEFDPFSPAFGEKSAPPNLPVSIKDWAGNEISRVYADQWGVYNGMNFSTYGVNPPDPSGYVPQMMVTCMNDAGDPAHPDPLYNPAYSQFCYEIPFMPGQTQYMDTPVVPTSAFAGAGYNNPDCAYPDATPAISQVDGDGVGPWVSTSGSGHTLTIHALGDLMVNNYGYSGPSATTAPYNQKKVTRHYGFGTTAGTVALVGSDGVSRPLTGVSWSDLTITGTVPNNVPLCTQQQQAQYGGSSARCGELVVTAANGKQSIDTVTVTIGGKAPTRLAAGQTIQSAIDAAQPGDLLIVPPGSYNELVIMWKPVRLQGVGAASSVINANTHPAGVLDPWRAKMICLFGLALNGSPLSANNPYDPSGALSCETATFGPNSGFHGGINNPQVDRLPLEGILGWTAQTNGNLAQQLQEPTLLGAYEGAGITVVAKGVRYPAGADFIFGNGPDNGSVATAGQFPLGTNLLTNSTADCDTTSTGATGYASNFLCNPSRIDGLSVTNSSQGGGGILVHAWGHNLEISNNRVYNNTGSLTGGISVGIGETPDALLTGNGGIPLGFDQQPWTCVPGAVVGGVQIASPPGRTDNSQLPFCYDQNVAVHHNAITTNSSIGDELFSATPAGSGGVTLCPGADGYRLTQNWICGNLSTGDGAGVTHLGYIENGLMDHNSILFNQSSNPTVPANGGGIIVMSTAPDANTGPGGAECGAVTDVDCAPDLGDGTGPGLVINANLIMGNAADAGAGGGIRFQGVNGTEVSRFPLTPANWYEVNVTNNIITNNVAGWDGAGVSLVDSLKVNLINNTIVSNDSTASSGALFTTFRAVQGLPSANIPGCTTPTCLAAPQPAGVSAAPNSASMIASFTGPILCPAGHTTTANPLLPLPALNGSCRTTSFPILYNNLIWQNRAFHIDVAPLSPQFDQAVVTLVPTLNQTSTGACMSGASYWDVGVRGDLSATDHTGTGVTLAPVSSVLTSLAGGYSGNHNSAANPTLLSEYCNGSRVPPENGGLGYNVPPGTNENNVPTPVFSLTAGATVDEANNWINISWGPLALTRPSNGAVLGDYRLAAGSPAIDYVTLLNSGVAYTNAPTADFFNNPRKVVGNLAVDVGAVEGGFTGGGTGVATISPASVAFGNVFVGNTSTVQTLTLTNNTGAGITGLTVAVATTSPSSTPNVFARSGGTCGTTLANGANCSITVTFAPAAAVIYAGSVTVSASVGIVNSPVILSGTGQALAATVAPASLAFGSVVVNQQSANRTLTLTNPSGTNLTGIVVTVTAPFNRNGGTCGATLNAGANCTILVRYSPTATGAAAGTATVAGSFPVTGSPVSLTGTGIAAPAKPTLTVLDNFNRANATTLGANWLQATPLGVAAIQVNANQALDPTLPGTAFWNATAFGAKEGAAFTIAGTTFNNDALLLAATGTPLASVYPNSVRVLYNGTTVTVATTTNFGITYTTAGTLTVAALANGDTLTAVLDGTGVVAAPSVYVWRTRAGVDTFLGEVQITPNALWSGGGRIGIQMPANATQARIDDFAGGTTP